MNAQNQLTAYEFWFWWLRMHGHIAARSLLRIIKTANNKTGKQMSGLSQRDLKLIISLLSNKAALVIIAALILLSMCSENNESSTPTTNLAPKTLTTPQEIRIERYVNTGKLNKRNSPNGEIIGSIARGNKVEIYETKGSWVRVSAENYPPECVNTPQLVAV